VPCGVTGGERGCHVRVGRKHERNMMKALSEILEEIAEGPAVRFAAVVTKDGFVIERSAGGSEADELIAAQAATLLAHAEAMAEELQGGETRQVVARYARGLLVVDSLDEETLLVTAVSSESSMAWVKFAVHKYKSEIAQML
jgi:predicted regulator of Ras-like GTPase activity (Roadblock/LC7/MglB family)